MESEHIQIDSKGNRIIIQGASYNLLDLIHDMVTNRKGLLSLDNHTYNFLITLNFPKSLITNKQIPKNIQEHSNNLTLKEEEKDCNSVLKNTDTPSANTTISSRNTFLMKPVVMVRQKRRHIGIKSSPSSLPTNMQKRSRHYITCLRSKWLVLKHDYEKY